MFTKRFYLSFLLLSGCVSEAENTAFRCDDSYAVGFVGLDSVTLSGNTSVSGPYNAVFSNRLVKLVGGSVELEGDAISGGNVVTGPSEPGGRSVEGVVPINVADPTNDVMLAKVKNDNHKIVCSKCLRGYELTSGADVFLREGRYYFDGINFHGQGRLLVEGSVEIYLSGDATFNGGSSTNPALDGLSLYSSSTGTIKFSGNSEINMKVFAPLAAVSFSGTTSFTGGVVGKTLEVSGTSDLVGAEQVAEVIGNECEEMPDLPELPH